MRYHLAGRERLEALMTGSGLVSGTVGIAAAVARRAIGPLALPMAVGGGLMWLGRSIGESYIDVDDDFIQIKMGVLFDEIVPLSEIARARRTTWKMIGGLGVRTNMRDMVAIVTQAGPVAELALWRPRRTPVIPRVYHVRAQRLLVSPERLDDFIADVRSRLEP